MRRFYLERESTLRFFWIPGLVLAPAGVAQWSVPGVQPGDGGSNPPSRSKTYAATLLRPHLIDIDRQWTDGGDMCRLLNPASKFNWQDHVA